MNKVLLIALLLAAPVYAAEPEDKELTMLRLQKIIAEQQMIEHMEYWRVREFLRIRDNYQKLIAEIEKREKAPPPKKPAPEYSPRDWGEK